MKFDQPTLVREIVIHLNANSLSVREMERLAGFPHGVLARIVKGTKRCGKVTYNRLSAFIDFSVVAREEAMRFWVPYGRKEKREETSFDPQPYPITVRKLKHKRPAYNFPVPA